MRRSNKKLIFFIILHNSFLPIKGEKKDALLRSVFTGLKHISNPSDAGLLLYLSIQAIHPFVDGNGRTGRLLYFLFSHSGQPIRQKDILPLISHPQSDDDQIGRHKIQETIKPPKEIIDIFNQVKQGQVEGLIDTISHPNQFCLKDGTSLKDCYFTQTSLF